MDVFRIFKRFKEFLTPASFEKIIIITKKRRECGFAMLPAQTGLALALADERHGPTCG